MDLRRNHEQTPRKIDGASWALNINQSQFIAIQRQIAHRLLFEAMKEQKELIDTSVNVTADAPIIPLVGVASLVASHPLFRDSVLKILRHIENHSPGLAVPVDHVGKTLSEMVQISNESLSQYLGDGESLTSFDWESSRAEQSLPVDEKDMNVLIGAFGVSESCEAVVSDLDPTYHDDIERDANVLNEIVLAELAKLAELDAEEGDLTEWER
ncbi:hypothetical protein HOF56_01520 [Candidatus Peribacteria bacterium]|jgi:hypothetical protein|nr:hypothetical protein [Candidatus Peribacteria bacterium]MBT4020770.1 hypothetical protein [Candidatus Peribacteria bacterium]MBT4241050.1 hypothetical protein [Candidatus Peribacteria bacterium]MBT4474451.1 hypothetical protein [Candidatus Peribacteria bacterium]